MTPSGLIRLKNDEGFKSKPYLDTLGILTIGYGTNLSAGLTEGQASSLLQNDLEINRSALNRLDWFDALSYPRQDVIENMAYNVGLHSLLDFTHMIDCLRVRDFDGAAREMLSSTWAQQVGERAGRLAQIMRQGAY